MSQLISNVYVTSALTTFQVSVSASLDKLFICLNMHYASTQLVTNSFQIV